MTFSSLKDSNIVTATEKGAYGRLKWYLGPNYEAWTQGNLKRYNDQYKYWTTKFS